MNYRQNSIDECSFAVAPTVISPRVILDKTKENINNWYKLLILIVSLSAITTYAYFYYTRLPIDCIESIYILDNQHTSCPDSRSSIEIVVNNPGIVFICRCKNKNN